MDAHERRGQLFEARFLIANAVLSVLEEARDQGELLTTADIARRLEWSDYYDTLRDVLRGLKATNFVVDENPDGYYRQWSIADDDEADGEHRE